MSVNATVTVDEIYSSEVMPLGSIYVDKSTGKRYRFIYNAGSTTFNVGCLTFRTATDDNVTCSTNGSFAARCLPAGIAISAIPTTKYGYIQVYGIADEVLTNGDDDIAKGALIVGASNVSGLCDSIAPGEALTSLTPFKFGAAVTADVNASNTVAVFLELD